MAPERAALGNLEFAGQFLEIAFRLRGSTTSPAARVSAIGLDASLTPRTLRDVLASSDWAMISSSERGMGITSGAA